MGGMQILEVPPGYPDYLPKPVLRDGGLYLSPYPAMPNVLFSQIPNNDVAWVMVALQPWILKYSPTPYDINWVIDGWGSGKAHILSALNGMRMLIQKGPPWAPQQDFLLPPKEPTGFDRFLIGLNKVLPDIMARLFDAFVPGTGQTIRQLVGNSAGSWDPVTKPIILPGGQPQNDQLPADSGGISDQWPLYVGGALLLIGLIFEYDSNA